MVALGETGLDFYRDYAPRADQERWFRAQLALADELGLPVVIHQRSALAETLAILEELRPQAGGVLHCFDDGPEAVERARALGFRLGIGGCLTYGHGPLEEAVKTAPAEMLVLETDSPWLEPEPRSLRRNEPGLLAAGAAAALRTAGLDARGGRPHHHGQREGVCSGSRSRSGRLRPAPARLKPAVPPGR